MEYIRLGSTGLKVSRLCLGCMSYGLPGESNPWALNEEQSRPYIQRALEAGINFFDTANVYSSGMSETVLGNTLRDFTPRDEVVIATKLFFPMGQAPNDRGLSRKHVVEGTDAALARLGLDYVDLVFCHRADLHTPVEETVRAMNHVIDQGKALYWGTSEWPATRILEAFHVARRERLVPPLMEQPQYNLLHRERVEREYAPLYERFGLGTTIWSPLAGGLLTGKYNEGVPQGTRSTLEGYEWLRSRFEGEQAMANIEKVRKLAPIADDLGCTQAQLAIAWCLVNPRVSTVITGASRSEQVVENMAAMEVVERLTPEVLERIESVVGNRPETEPDWR